jgi:hypothetical protein
MTRIDKKSALLRLGWLRGDSSDLKRAFEKLRTQVKFLEIPPFPTTVLEFKRDDESVARVPSPTVGQEGGGSASPVAPSALADPFQKKPLGLKGK